MAAIQNQISNFSRQTQVGSSWWASVLNICKHKYELGPHIKMEPLIMISRLIKVKSFKKKGLISTQPNVFSFLFFLMGSQPNADRRNSGFCATETNI